MGRCGWQEYYICTHGLGCYLTMLLKYTKRGTQELKVDLMTRGMPESKFRRNAQLRVLEPREPGRGLYVGIVSNLL